jgi:hypothetical protein
VEGDWFHRGTEDNHEVPHGNETDAFLSDRSQSRAVVKTVMNFALRKKRIFFWRLGTISFKKDDKSCDVRSFWDVMSSSSAASCRRHHHQMISNIARRVDWSEAGGSQDVSLQWTASLHRDARKSHQRETWTPPPLSAFRRLLNRSPYRQLDIHVWQAHYATPGMCPLLEHQSLIATKILVSIWKPLGSNMQDLRFHGGDYEDYEEEREVGSSERHCGWGEQSI